MYLKLDPVSLTLVYVHIKLRTHIVFDKFVFW